MRPTELADLARVRSLARTGAARSIRLGAGVSYSEVGEAVGCSPSTVFRWEHGQRAPRGQPALRYLETLERLMRSNG